MQVSVLRANDDNCGAGRSCDPQGRRGVHCRCRTPPGAVKAPADGNQPAEDHFLPAAMGALARTSAKSNRNSVLSPN